MSNVDRPFGARAARSGVSASYTGQSTQYRANDDRSVTNGFGNIYAGDFVKFENGFVSPAVSGDVILGVVVGAGPDGDVTHGRSGAWNAEFLEERFLAADRTGIVHVIDDPNVIFAIQEDADAEADALTDADAGSTRDITTEADESHGSDLSGASTVEVSSTADVNSDLLLIARVDQEDNSEGPKAKWLVKINNHFYNQ